MFSQDDRDKWNDKDIANLIAQKTDKFEENLHKREIIIKAMFNCKEIWQQVNENNLQSFDEITKWFEIMRDYFQE